MQYEIDEIRVLEVSPLFPLPGFDQLEVLKGNQVQDDVVLSYYEEVLVFCLYFENLLVILVLAPDFEGFGVHETQILHLIIFEGDQEDIRDLKILYLRVLFPVEDEFLWETVPECFVYTLEVDIEHFRLLVAGENYTGRVALAFRQLAITVSEYPVGVELHVFFEGGLPEDEREGSSIGPLRETFFAVFFVARRNLVEKSEPVVSEMLLVRINWIFLVGFQHTWKIRDEFLFFGAVFFHQAELIQMEEDRIITLGLIKGKGVKSRYRNCQDYGNFFLSR